MKMPFFGSKFSSKKAPTRKTGFYTNENLEDLFLENRIIPLKLGNKECVFENGIWCQDNESGAEVQKSLQKLKEKLQEVNEENNMLKLKTTILMNMLTQATTECHSKQKEIDSLLLSLEHKGKFQ